jgi:hypothetical protein
MLVVDNCECGMGVLSGLLEVVVNLCRMSFLDILSSYYFR